MASQIDPSKPVIGKALTQSIRDNFSTAKNEMEQRAQALADVAALQAHTRGSKELVVYMYGDYAGQFAADLSDTTTATDTANYNTIVGADNVRWKRVFGASKHVPVDNHYELLTNQALRVHGQQVKRRAFYADADGGADDIWYDASCPQSSANGITIFDPDNMGGFDGTTATLQAYYAAQGGGTGSGCFRTTKGTIDPTRGGHKSNDPSTAIAFSAAVQAAVNAGMAIGATRLISLIRYPAGLFYVQPGCLSAFAGQLFGSMIRGAGIDSTALVLTGDGSFCAPASNGKAQQLKFSDLSLCGDANINEAPSQSALGTRSVLTTVPGISGIQGWEFDHVAFERFSVVFDMEGSDNDSEFTFYSTRLTNCQDYIWANNAQMFNWNHYGPSYLPRGRLIWNKGSIGGSIGFHGGNIIAYGTDPLVQFDGSGDISGRPHVGFYNGTRIEVRGPANPIFQSTVDNASMHVVMQNAVLLLENGPARLADVRGGTLIEFDSVSWGPYGTAGWTINLIGQGNHYMQPGIVRMRGCAPHFMPSNVTTDTSNGSNLGFVINEEPRVHPQGAVDDQTARGWTVAPQSVRRAADYRYGFPTHRFSLFRFLPYASTSASQPSILPEGAIITRIALYIPPGQGNTGNVKYGVHVNSGTPALVAETAFAAQNAGVWWEVKPSDFAALSQAAMTGTDAERTVLFSATDDGNTPTPQAGIGGWGVIEYI